MKSPLLFGVIAFIMLLSSLPALASHKTNSIHSNSNSNVRLFYTHESNNNDHIYGFGTGLRFTYADSSFGYELNTSLNAAEITTEQGYVEDFIAWQGSIKAGYFSDVSFYVEAGIDLTELFFSDWRDDDHHDFHFDFGDSSAHYHDSENLDSFIGLGGGIKAGPIKFEAFSRWREIDSLYWEAEADVFTGIQVSINF